MEIEKIRQLMDMAANSPFVEFIYQEGEAGLTLRRPGAVSGQINSEKAEISAEWSCGVENPANAVSSGISADAADTSSAGMTEASAGKPEEPLPDSYLASENVINSPLVGVFYTSPAEGEPPFVKIGSYVRKGQVVGIIETMKLMNELEAEEEGEITGILVENEQVVEYGQPLFRIRPM